MRNYPPVTDLVIRAKNGDKQAWDALVERYAPLIWSICRRYRLGNADAEDVNQSVWLILVDQLAALREPAALPGWLATTTQRECGRVLRAAHRTQPGGQMLEDSCQELLAMLIHDPPVPYAQISAELGIPVGSIGPTRSRCLNKLRSHPAIAALIDAQTGSRPNGLYG